MLPSLSFPKILLSSALKWRMNRSRQTNTTVFCLAFFISALVLSRFKWFPFVQPIKIYEMLDSFSPFHYNTKVALYKISDPIRDIQAHKMPLHVFPNSLLIRFSGIIHQTSRKQQRQITICKVENEHRPSTRFLYFPMNKRMKFPLVLFLIHLQQITSKRETSSSRARWLTFKFNFHYSVRFFFCSHTLTTMEQLTRGGW